MATNLKQAKLRSDQASATVDDTEATDPTEYSGGSVTTIDPATEGDYPRYVDQYNNESDGDGERLSPNLNRGIVIQQQRQTRGRLSRTSMSMRNLGSSTITPTAHRGGGQPRGGLTKDMSMRSLPATIQNVIGSKQHEKTSDEVACILQNQHDINLILSRLIVKLSVSGTNSGTSGVEKLQTLVENLCKKQEYNAERLDAIVQTLLEETAIQKSENGNLREHIVSLKAYIARRTRSTKKRHENREGSGGVRRRHNHHQQDLHDESNGIHEVAMAFKITEINVPTTTIDISNLGEDDFNRLGIECDSTVRLEC